LIRLLASARYHTGDAYLMFFCFAAAFIDFALPLLYFFLFTPAATGRLMFVDVLQLLP